MRLITVDQFRQRYFADGSRPDRRTVRSWIESGEIPGRAVGKRHYVDEEAWLADSEHELVEHVLRDTA
ncbi:hypothetical protein [Halorhodospira halophila]|uniref:hypothetical protein n=1 Tax=Halorhodospira halophila TaxID=1053 RepID=UPI001911E17B|nr:hypothetical protein [Halorhodospira halophila]MBK5942756.1 hypothetical protein [Halorhodospira halophila]